jgi:thiol:disulfide interchange protein/DsbC/DsbD-like thiol-disulfide interchange protein
MLWFRTLALLMLGASCAVAQLGDIGFAQLPGARKRPVRARLVLSHEVAKPGDTVMAGVELTHDPGWHTYWKNPGVGIATTIHWSLTNGVTAGEIQWPVPEKILDPVLRNASYAYHDTVVLLVPVTIANDAPAGTQNLAALIKWLQCDPSQCVPASNSVSAALTIGNESKPSADAKFFTEAQRRLPSKQLPGSATARWDGPPSLKGRPLVINWTTEATEPDFFPYTNAVAVISNKTDVSTAPGNAVLRKNVRTREGQWPTEIAGVLVRKEEGALRGYEVSLPMATAAAQSAATSPGSAVKADSKSLLVWLLYAFIGGLILNIMPCVLPVIALKILGFVHQSREHPKAIRKLGILYTLGVIASFLVLAGVVIAIQSAGQRAGWGMQFSNPVFIVGLTVVVTLVALNLFGVFEITLSGSAMDAASGAASKHGSLGAFMNGVLATVLATPCTAPFLAAALGFAFFQPPYVIVLVFLTIGLGLALPYLLLSWHPGWLKFLPKPGAWMERFKVLMGFPMLATAVWLFTLTERFYGNRIWWLGAFLVILALCAWIYGEFVQRGRARRTMALAIVAVLLVGSFVYAVENKLQWRSPVADAGGGSEAVRGAPAGIPWQRWSPENVAKARAEGRPVIVDFTAEWCITCNTVVKPALESSAVQARLKEMNVAALVADYTTFPPEISAELEKHGRAGVPMVLVYPKDPSRPAIVVPDAIIWNVQANHILKALDEAAKGSEATPNTRTDAPANVPAAAGQ